MNKIESIIYNLVKDNPLLKQKIVDLYQNILGFIPKVNIESSFPVSFRPGFFYGFHDKSPFSTNGKFLLAHKNQIGNQVVNFSDKVDVGFFSGDGWMNFNHLGVTSGWNWQLGSMLQWVGDVSDAVIYNDYINNRQISVSKSLDGVTLKSFKHPIAHISSDGKLACSYNFVNVETAMPGYGIVAGNIDSLNDSDFRIFSLDDEAIFFKLTIEEVKKISPHPSMDGAYHFFHHSLFNPSGKRVFFLHRWVDLNSRRWTRMFSVGSDGSDLYLFPMEEMVSHITWASDTQIFSYLRYPKLGDGYFLLNDLTGSAVQLFKDVLNSDGHPTLDIDRGIAITDTYPDRFRYQYLVLLLLSSGKRINLSRTFLPKLFRRELQVDLHPRLHPFMNIVSFDSGHNGVRSLNTLDFSTVLFK